MCILYLNNAVLTQKIKLDSNYDKQRICNEGMLSLVCVSLLYKHLYTNNKRFLFFLFFFYEKASISIPVASKVRNVQL